MLINHRRPHIKQYTATNKGGGAENQREHNIMWTKYEAVHPTADLENNSSSGMLIILSKHFYICHSKKKSLKYSAAVALMYLLNKILNQKYLEVHTSF